MSALQYIDKPIRLWATGTLVSMSVSTPAGDQSPHTRISVNLVNRLDMQRARGLLNLAGENYKHPIATLNAICVSPFATVCSLYLHTLIPSSIVLWQAADSIYDATDRYTLADRMPKIPFWQLGQGDIVVLECFLVRTKVGYRWSGSFHAKALFVLWRKPRSYTNITDDMPTFPPFWYL